MDGIALASAGELRRKRKRSHLPDAVAASRSATGGLRTLRSQCVRCCYKFPSVCVLDAVILHGRDHASESQSGSGPCCTVRVQVA